MIADQDPIEDDEHGDDCRCRDCAQHWIDDFADMELDVGRGN